MRAFVSLLLLLLALPAAAAERAYTFLVRDVGARVDWGPNNRIAFDRVDDSGWFQVWTMQADGTRQACLTCKEGFSKLHNGNPAWHPSGDYIVFQALDETIKIPPWRDLYRLYTNPGAGVHNNIWIATADGSRAWQMTDLGKGRGVLHPHFSPDGSKLMWAEMISTQPKPTGQWVIKVATFTVRRRTPVLSRVVTLTPGDMQFYETHSFSPDGGEILFTGLRKGEGERHFDIYKYNLADGTLAALTPEREEFWDEHAHFSPDGTRIVWMSSKDNGGAQTGAFVRTDWWLMNADGSGKRRLTWFNKKGAPEYIRGKAIAADVSWNPTGKEVVGYLEENPTATRPGHIVRFRVD